MAPGPAFFPLRWELTDFCPGRPGASILLVSASQIAWTTGASRALLQGEFLMQVFMFILVDSLILAATEICF
jgi:hypothetical protein